MMQPQTSQGMKAATGSWRRQGMDSPQEPPEEAQPCQHLGFSLMKPISDF